MDCIYTHQSVDKKTQNDIKIIDGPDNLPDDKNELFLRIIRQMSDEADKALEE